MNDSATIHRQYQRFRAFVRPSIFALLGLSLLLLLFRKNVIEVVGTWWYDTVLSGVVVCIFITGIFSFFKGSINNSQRLYQQSTNNNESIQQQKTRLKQLSHDEVQERFRSKVNTHSRPLDPINIPVMQKPSEKETYRLRNLLLKKADILGEQNIALKHLRKERTNQAEKIQQLHSEMATKDEYIQQKNIEAEILKDELKMSKQQVERLQKELLIKDEELKQKKSLEDFEKVSKEAQKLQKQVPAKDIMNYEKDEKIKELKNAYSKLEQKLRQKNTLLLPKKRQISRPARTLQQTPVHSVVVFVCNNILQVEEPNDINNKENLNLPRKQSSPSDVNREKCQSRTLQQTPIHSVVICKNVQQLDAFDGNNETVNLLRKQSSPSKFVCESYQPRTLQQTSVHSVVVLCKNILQVQQQNDINDKENLNLPRKQSSPSKIVCEKCQVQQKDEDKELGLPRKRDDAVSNITCKNSSSPESLPAHCDVVVEPDDDPTFPPPLFSSSTPCFMFASSESESALNSVKETPPFKISPKPENTVSPTNSQRSPSAFDFDTPKKSVTRSFIYPITPKYPRSIIYHNKSYIEPSSNDTPKRTPQGRRRFSFL